MKPDPLELARRIEQDGSWCVLGYEPAPETIGELARALIALDEQVKAFRAALEMLHFDDDGVPDEWPSQEHTRAVLQRFTEGSQDESR